MNKRDLLLNPMFLSGLTILILNDSLLKWHFSNCITDKLSDFAGLFILPMFLAYIIPKSRTFISLIIGLLFILWKSPISSPILELMNSMSMVQFHRVIDYSDLIALSVLPLSHLFINKNICQTTNRNVLINYFRVSIIVISSFVFMATSMTRHGLPNGTIYLGDSYKVNMSKDTLLNRMGELGYEWKYIMDTTANQNYYQIENVIISDDEIVIDTLKNIKFKLTELVDNKSKIELLNVELQQADKTHNWKYLKQMRKLYKKKIREVFLEDVEKQH